MNILFVCTLPSFISWTFCLCSFLSVLGQRWSLLSDLGCRGNAAQELVAERPQQLFLRQTGPPGQHGISPILQHWRQILIGCWLWSEGKPLVIYCCAFVVNPFHISDSIIIYIWGPCSYCFACVVNPFHVLIPSCTLYIWASGASCIIHCEEVQKSWWCFRLLHESL